MRRSAPSRSLLVVDVGNTSTAVGRWRARRVTAVTHHDDGFAGASAAAENLVRCDPDSWAGLAYLSVVPRLDGLWRRFADAQGLPFIAIDSRLFPAGRKPAAGAALTLDYPAPETIGADRLADAAAAVDRYGAPLIVCDFGTAFTATLVTADRLWRGGVIAPGFPLMRDYLFERTAKLPRLELGGRIPRIGRSTQEAMRFGARVGYRGMVREIVTTLERNFRTKTRRIATGGFARWVLDGAGLDFTLDPNLTLYGAGLLADRALKDSLER